MTLNLFEDEALRYPNASAGAAGARNRVGNRHHKLAIETAIPSIQETGPRLYPWRKPVSACRCSRAGAGADLSYQSSFMAANLS